MPPLSLSEKYRHKHQLKRKDLPQPYVRHFNAPCNSTTDMTLPVQENIHQDDAMFMKYKEHFQIQELDTTYKYNKMELLQAPAEGEMLGSSAVRTSDI